MSRYRTLLAAVLVSYSTVTVACPGGPLGQDLFLAPQWVPDIVPFVGKAVLSEEFSTERPEILEMMIVETERGFEVGEIIQVRFDGSSCSRNFDLIPEPSTKYFLAGEFIEDRFVSFKNRNLVLVKMLSGFLRDCKASAGGCDLETD